MQAGPMDEPPSILWGLDPIFSAFARLYIKDILQMTESVQVPGIYFYNNHPIYKVDVLGTVVYKRERDDFFCYGVDDGTGVINCLCWKSELFKDKDDGAGAAPGPSDPTVFDPVAELKKLKQAQQKRCRLEIGELIRVRGPVKTSRQQREITASVFYKVEDPLMAEQIQWMMDVPELYRECYDKTFQLQSDKQGESADSPLIKATNLIKDFIKQKSVSKFRTYDVLDLLEPLISRQPQAASADPVRQNTAETFCLKIRFKKKIKLLAFFPPHLYISSSSAVQEAAGPSGCQQVRQLLKEVLKVLQDEGVVYRRVKTQDEVYHVTERDKDLFIVVKDIIREDSKREKYSEKGCHVLHILSAVRQRHSLNVSKAALEIVLKSLECNSDIVSSSDKHYTAF
ncbi:CST complex subunit STN1 [Oryzias melastigma]|uniref:CST complex subunit STN1 n=1 Tax=Oryzias melastigma TaxID=30732 RepID=A0A834C8H9_ORYME|nr:CST complex subunit STN1 [Oryzias melastigma]